MIISDSLLIYVMDFRHHSTAPQLLRKCYLHVREEISFPIIFSSLSDVRLAVLLEHGHHLAAASGLVWNIRDYVFDLQALDR